MYFGNIPTPSAHFMVFPLPRSFVPSEDFIADTRMQFVSTISACLFHSKCTQACFFCRRNLHSKLHSKKQNSKE